MRKSEPADDLLKQVILDTALSAVVDTAPKGCEGLTIAVADFALHGARKLLHVNTHPDVTPCPKHNAAAMIVDGLIWALAATLAKVTEKSEDPAAQEALFRADLSARVFDQYDAALRVWRDANAARAAQKAPTHDLAGGVQ